MTLWEGTRKHLPRWEYGWICFRAMILLKMEYRFKKLSGFYVWCAKRY